MNDVAFRDCRPVEIRREEGPSARALLPFVVLVKRDDGRVVRFDVLDGSRYQAARQALEAMRVHERRGGVVIAVLLEFDPREPLGLGEELQGLGDFSVLVETPAGIRSVVGVRAASRSAALELATRSVPGSWAVLARVRYVAAGTCSYCGVCCFQDMKIRESRRGLKCWDCA